MALRKAARRKAVKFTTSTKSDAETDADCSSSEGETPPPIPARKGSTPIHKRMKPGKGMDVANMFRAPTHVSAQASLPTLSESEAPSRKRQRVTRQREHNPLNYDARLHPLDKYTRPSHFAKVNAEHGMITEIPLHGDVSDEDNDASADGNDQIPQASVEDGLDSDEVDVLEVMGLPAESSSNTQTHAKSQPHLPSPDCRRSSRTLGRSEVPNYDMKVHLDYDRVHRPATFKAALARKDGELKSRRTSAEADTMSTLVDNDTTAQGSLINGPLRDAAAVNLTLSKVQSIAIPPLSEARQSASETLPSRNSYLSKTLRTYTAIDFHDLSSLDSRLYRLQYGAPTNGDTLPNTWEYVKQDLFENRHLCLDDLSSQDGTEWIKARYELIRTGVEAFWASKPEPADARDWTLRRMEGFRVFDQKPKSKYWKHYEDSLYQPTSINWTGGQVTETHNEGEAVNNIVLPYHESEEHANPWIVGADEVASGAPSPVHTKSEQDPASAFGNRDKKQGYIDLGDGDEDKGHSDIDPDRPLVESMRGTVQSSEPLISSQELRDLLSPVAEYLTDYVVGSPTNIILSNPASSDSAGLPPLHDDLAANLSAKSPPRLLKAFEYDKEMLAPVADDPDSRLYVDLLQAATVAVKGKRRTIRKGKKVVIHEDSPSRKAVISNSKSPKTDLLKENFKEEEPEYSADIHLRTPTARQPHEAVVPPSTPKAAADGNEYNVPTHTSLFGGPIGWTSPST